MTISLPVGECVCVCFFCVHVCGCAVGIPWHTLHPLALIGAGQGRSLREKLNPVPLEETEKQLNHSEEVFY